jgi:predicted  nucleic acid-binding Zn-ribbon protein
MSQNESMHSDIKSLESNINNASMDVKANEGAQEIKTKEIYRQKELAASIKEKETKKTAEKVLKDLNKDNKRLRDEHESLNQKIVKYRAEIESIKVNVRTNLQDQYLKNQDVSKQRSYLRGVEAMAGKIH